MTSTRELSPDAATATVAGALASELRTAVSHGLQWLHAVSESDSPRRPRPGGWSPREIVGHLIDSASNNHGRFVRGALEDTLVFAPYDQEGWVALQRYQEQQWGALLERWAAFNDQVAVSIENIDDAMLTRRRAEHNFDRIAWKPIAAGDPATLQYFIRDYIGHLRHHLAQIAEIVGARPR